MSATYLPNPPLKGRSEPDPNIFSDKSALILEWLLMHAVTLEQFSLREVHTGTGVSLGLTQRVITALVNFGWVTVKGHRTAKAFVLHDPRALITAWISYYKITARCRMCTYRSPFTSMAEMEDLLLKQPALEQALVWALHSAARHWKSDVSNLNTVELYLLQPEKLLDIEQTLQLKPSNYGYDVCIIFPYYKAMLKKSLQQIHDKSVTTAPLLLTYLDLMHFPLRGEEQAENLMEKNLSLKRILRPALIQNSASPQKQNYKNLSYEEKILDTFMVAAGPWISLLTIGGGMALLIYHSYMSGAQSPTPVGTRDIDTLLPRHLKKIPPGVSLAERLLQAGFVQRFKDLSSPPTEAYVKILEDKEFEVEFLTDQSTRANREKNVVISGVTAQPLRYISLSLENTLPFTSKEGFHGKVVAPWAWVLHKGLTFTRRKLGSSKFYKDLYGIWYVFTQLGMLSQKTQENLPFLAKSHPRSYKKFQQNLKRWSEKASPKEWRLLEQQDPSGRLQRHDFSKLIKKL